MQLAIIADFVTKRVGMVQPRDLAFCKTSLSVRHDQLWRMKLWKDSIVEYDLPITPGTTPSTYVPNNNYMPTKGVIILPSIISKVLAVRTTEHFLSVVRPMMLYRVDPDVFVKTGTPLDFFLLSAAAWDFDTVQPITLAPTSGADLNVQANITTVSATDAVSETTTAYQLQNTYVSAGSTGTIHRLNKPATVNPVVLGVWFTLNTSAITYINNSGPTQAVVPVTQGQLYQLTVVGNEGQGQLINGNQIVNLVVGQTYIVTAQGSTLLFSTPPGDGTIYLGPPPFPFQSTLQQWYPVLTLAPATTDAPQCERIRLSDIPDTATMVRVLGKRTSPPFAADTDSPGVAGMEPALMAMAEWDMLHRDERGGNPESDGALKAAELFLKDLENEEVLQAAHNSQIQPVSGFGPDDDVLGPQF